MNVSDPTDAAESRAVSYVRIYTDEDNVTRFEDLDFSLVPAVYAPPAPPVSVTTLLPATGLLFLRVPAGWADAAHPAPARQLVFILEGELEGTAGPETRRFGPGTVALTEDTDGPGHGLTALTDLLLAVVRL